MSGILLSFDDAKVRRFFVSHKTLTVVWQKKRHILDLNQVFVRANNTNRAEYFDTSAAFSANIRTFASL